MLLGLLVFQLAKKQLHGWQHPETSSAIGFTCALPFTHAMYRIHMLPTGQQQCWIISITESVG
jgi:hypothetical protein